MADIDPEIKSIELQKQIENLKQAFEEIKNVDAATKAQLETKEELVNSSLRNRIALLQQLKDNYLAQGAAGIEAATKTAQEIAELNKQLEKSNERIEETTKSINKLKEAGAKAGTFLQDTLFKPISLGATLQAIPALDRLRTEFVKNTGASAEYEKQITKVQGTLTRFGISNEQASKILQDVYLNFDKFGISADSTNQKLLRVAGQFTKLGVPADQFAKTISEATNLFGISTDEAVSAQQDLAKVAQGLNISIGDLNNKFLGAMDKFAVYGKNAREEFIKFNTVAKATGLEMGTLQDLSERLTTFEATSEIAGRLNALAGKDVIDAVSLATLEGEERINYLRTQLKGAFDFETLSPQRLRALSQASGIAIGDLKKLAREGATEDINALQEKVAQSRMQTDEELEKTSDRATAAVDKLAAEQEKIRNSFIDSTGALDKFRGIVNFAAGATAALGAASSVAAVAVGTLCASGGLPKGLGALGGKIGSAVSKSGIASPGAVGASRAVAKLGRGIPIVGGLISGATTGASKYEKTGDVSESVLSGLGAAGITAGLGALGFMAGGPLGAAIGASLGDVAGDYLFGGGEEQNTSDMSVSMAGGRPKVTTYSAGQLSPKTFVGRQDDTPMFAMGTKLGGNSANDPSYKELISALKENTAATRDNTTNSGNSTSSGGWSSRANAPFGTLT
jgi:hypothetical protein